MPAVGTSFLLADHGAVVALLDRSAPGTAVVSQVWIAAPGQALDKVRASLESSPAAAASLSYRVDIARALAEDPVATRSITLLTIAGGIALALAMVAVATAVRADLEQTAADQFALEVDGLTTGRLRLIALVRAGLILLAGVPVGVLGGLALTALAVRLLVTGPGGAVVIPALRVIFAPLPTLFVVAAAVAGGLLASAAAAATALRRPLPRQPVLDLR
jgi:predicted lysophospholipase L1 biosynthesis ABC-type transport system permease subunit